MVRKIYNALENMIKLHYTGHIDSGIMVGNKGAYLL